MEHFNTLGLPESLQQSLKRLQFTTPTPIQAATIPLAMEGKDILGSAQTGTGKTLAFGIPLLAKLISDPQGCAIVITPTRELATQVMRSLQDLIGKEDQVKTALLIGGESMAKQLRQLQARPRLFVGTPGRITDHLERRTLSLKDANFLVLDETDRMLDMGFSVQINRILKFMPAKRQTLLFSATLPSSIVKLAESYMHKPQRVAIGATFNPVEKIKQDVIRLSDADKYPQLLLQLEQREGSIIIFVKTKFGTEKLAKRLGKEGHSTSAIHGDLPHKKRERVIGSFRNSEYRILVATDVAARGLDIPHIEHVINYDLPQCPEDYIHRIGRTARAGAQGESLCFITPADGGKWRAINYLINPDAAKSEPRGDRYQGNNYRGGKRRGPSSGSRSGYRSGPSSGPSAGSRSGPSAGPRTESFSGYRSGPAKRRSTGGPKGVSSGSGKSFGFKKNDRPRKNSAPGKRWASA